MNQFPALVGAGLGILAFDLPGHGESADAENPEAGYTIPAYAKTAAQLCDKLDLSLPVLCGWSLGGHIAIEMSGSRNDYSGLAICGTPPVGPGIEHAERAFLPVEVGDVTGAEAPSESRLNTYIKAVYGSLGAVPEVLRDAGFRADGRSRSTMFTHWVSGESGHDQRNIVQNWRKPLLVIHGADDAFVSADYIKELDMPGDRKSEVFRLIDNCGHAPFLEKPDAFNKLILEFCKRSFGDHS